MKKKGFVALGMAVVMMMGCITGCGQAAENAGTSITVEPIEAENATTEFVTYEFVNFEGETIVIDSSNIISQQSDENPLESSLVPADAEVVTPGRDYVYLEDASYYYVEDAVKNLVTIATRPAVTVSDEAVASEYEVFTADEYSFTYSTTDFVLNDVRGSMQLMYANEAYPYEGSNEIIFSKEEGTTVDEIVSAIAGDDVANVSDGTLGNQMIPVKCYSKSYDSTTTNPDLILVDSFMIMQSGDGVLIVELLRTVGQGDEIDMTVEGAFTQVLESFVLN